MDKFSINWQFIENGKVAESGTLPPISLEPNEKGELKIPFEKNLLSDKEYFITLYFSIKEDETWAEKGHIVANEQFALTPRQEIIFNAPVGHRKLISAINNKELTLEGTNFKVIFDTLTGVLKSLNYEGQDVIFNDEGLKLNWYRNISNDGYADRTYYKTQYAQSSFNYFESQNGQKVTITSMVNAKLNNDVGTVLPYTLVYTVLSNGRIKIDGTFESPPEGEIIHRLGLQMQLNPKLENVTWYGKGPFENYSDRKTGAFVGIYNSTVEDMATEHYLRSQSMGNREDIRWLQLTDSEGKGINIRTNDPLSFSALHYDDPSLWEEVKHNSDLKEVWKPQTFLNLDRIQEGVGNASCGPITLDKYRIAPDSQFKYSLIIEPLSNK